MTPPEGMDTRRKILRCEELASRLAEHRARGERIALATGGFDLLDGRQVRYLERARGEADVLVVAVDSDTQVRTRKGNGRPILRAEERAQLVAALRMVRYVVVRGDADGSDLLDVVQPDVYAPDDDAESAAERAAARKAGIRIASPGESGEDAARDVVERVRGLPHG
jgi:bifunctional ADP-heptose synthase (sugar kinase/adenylyltransferase)